ncbi:alpha/beta hydrolase [Magnetovibrio sp. PR-2]|uniref:alpha/beta fold hydrolase n=1 Tax=Magnetovibrio sp. PR-2 TaxID=3120356 RepID=UPI002FCDE3B7
MEHKPVLIVVPGLLCDRALWEPQIEALSDAYDVRVADASQNDSMEVIAMRLQGLAHGPFALAGLSMGGYVAQEVMRQCPERITHLALVDTNARADLPEQTENRKRTMNIADEGKLDTIVQEMVPNLVHPDHMDTAGKIFGEMAERVGAEAFVRQQTAIMDRIDGRDDLAAINCPTLILCGEDDALTPVKVHEEMADGIGANAELVVIEHCGHLSPLEKPEAVTDAFRTWFAR